MQVAGPSSESEPPSAAIAGQLSHTYAARRQPRGEPFSTKLVICWGFKPSGLTQHMLPGQRQVAGKQ